MNMNKFLTILLPAGILTSLLAINTVKPGISRDTHANTLIGSWKVSVTPNSETGVPQALNFTAMTSDGLVITSNQNGLASVGEWIRQGDHRFAVTFTGYDTSTGQTLLMKIRSAVELQQNGESFSGPFLTDFYDQDGNLRFSTSGTVEATRIQVEPLN